MATVITFNVTEFRASFPAFASEAAFPTPTLQGYWDSATCYISDVNYGRLKGSCRAQALNLMTAHLAALSVLIANGQTPALVQGSTVDKISVTLTPPPFKNQWQWWLALTPYGAQLFALLQVKSVGGMYIGGLPETSAFRKVYGVF